MTQKCNMTCRIVLVATLAVGLAACETEKSRNPLSPNVAGPMAGVNITAPPLMEPTDGGLVETGQPVVLKFGSVTSNSERPLWYQLQLAGDARFQQLVHEADRIGWDDEGGGAQSLSADGSHRYEVPVSLETGRAYWWRARAADGANIGPYSDRAKFEIYKPVTVGVPQPRSPIGGVIVAGRQPRFVVTTPQVTGPATQVRIHIEISTSNSFANPVASFSAAIGNDTTAARSGRLSLNTRYHWRARATAEGREGQILGNWSRTSTFRTPATVAGGSPSPTPAPSSPPSGGGGYTRGGSPNAPFTTNGSNPPNMLHIVQQVAQEHPQALRNSCQHHGGTWEFMDRVVERLRAIDGRYAYNCKRGNCGDVSQDVIDYYRGNGNPHGSSNVKIVDMTVGHCGPNPQPGWNDLTDATRQAGTIGRWKYPR